MKTIIKKITLMLLSPILGTGMFVGTLSMITVGCGGDSTTEKQNEVRYYDITVAGHNIEIMDNRTGYQDFETIKSILAQGVQDAISNVAFSDQGKFDTVFGLGLTIIVESGNGCVTAVDGSTISVGINFLLSANSIYIWSGILEAIIDAADGHFVAKSKHMKNSAMLASN